MPEITVKNCNSIDEANISIEIGKLNIKYGINGTGKNGSCNMRHPINNLYGHKLRPVKKITSVTKKWYHYKQIQEKLKEVCDG